MSHEQTYKVNHIQEDKTVAIYVFSGSKKETDLEKYFSPEEMERIQQDNTQIIFLTSRYILTTQLVLLKLRLSMK